MRVVLVEGPSNLCNAPNESCVLALGGKWDPFTVASARAQLSPILFVIFMDRIGRYGHGGEGVQCCEPRVSMVGGTIHHSMVGVGGTTASQAVME